MQMDKRTVFGVLLINRISIAIHTRLMRAIAGAHQRLINRKEEIASCADSNLVNEFQTDWTIRFCKDKWSKVMAEIAALCRWA